MEILRDRRTTRERWFSELLALLVQHLEDLGRLDSGVLLVEPADDEPLALSELLRLSCEEANVLAVAIVTRMSDL